MSRANEYAHALKQSPALPLLGFISMSKFFQGNEMVHFIPLATGAACGGSTTLGYLTERDENVVTRWMDARRAAGFLENDRRASYT